MVNLPRRTAECCQYGHCILLWQRAVRGRTKIQFTRSGRPAATEGDTEETSGSGWVVPDLPVELAGVRWAARPVAEGAFERARRGGHLRERCRFMRYPSGGWPYQCKERHSTATYSTARRDWACCGAFDTTATSTVGVSSTRSGAVCGFSELLDRLAAGRYLDRWRDLWPRSYP
jgi:hypothetical protein